MTAPASSELSPQVRVVGLDLEFIDDEVNEFSRNAALYRALRERGALVGRMSPRLNAMQNLSNLALQMHPDLRRWRSNKNFNPYLFRKRSEIAGRYLAALDGRYDVALVTYMQFSPGLPPGPQPFAVYMDATFQMGCRHYPDDHPLSRRDLRAWLELEREVYRRAAVLFPWSESAARSLIEDYGCDPGKVMVMGAGANMMADSLDGRSYNSQVALFTGFDFERKGGQDLLSAFREVRQQLPGAELWVVGPRAEGRPPQDGVRWMGPIYDRQKLAQLYWTAQVFVMPSFEPWGHVFCEAMGHGLPCIALAGSPSADILGGVAGVLVPQGDVNELVQALTKLLEDSTAAETLGRAGYARVQQHYTWERVVDRMLPQLARVAGKS